jgi:hypothetical protein
MSSNTTWLFNPLNSNKNDDNKNKLKQKMQKYTKEDINAVVAIQTAWRRTRQLIKWKQVVKDRIEKLKLNQRKIFSGILIVMSYSFQTVTYILLLTTDVYISSDYMMIASLYLTLLTWAIILPLRDKFQLKLYLWMSVAAPFIIGIVYIIVIMFLFSYWSSLLYTFLVVIIAVLLYWILESMSIIIQHIYKNDMYGVSIRIAGKVLSLLPVFCYLLFGGISTSMVFEVYFEEMCKYMPGSFQKAYIQTNGIQGMVWFNCSYYYSNKTMDDDYSRPKLDDYFPDRPSSTEEVMLQQEMKNYFGMVIYYRINLYQCIEILLLLLSIQILMRICRLTVNDILSLRLTKWELGLGLVNIVRVLILLITSSLNLELYKPSAINRLLYTLVYVMLVLYILTIAICIKLVRDAKLSLRLEMLEKKKKDYEKNEEENGKTTKYKSKSVELIHRRSRRASSIHGKKSIVSLDSIV